MLPLRCVSFEIYDKCIVFARGLYWERSEILSFLFCFPYVIFLFFTIFYDKHAPFHGPRSIELFLRGFVIYTTKFRLFTISYVKMYCKFSVNLNFFFLQAPTMLGVFGSLTSSIPIQKRLNEPHTEGVINRLHYSFTVLIFFGCSLLVTCLGM